MTKIHHRILIISVLFLSFIVRAQGIKFSEQDSLRGSITPEREWWDLTYYHLNIDVDPENKIIKGSNTIHYKVLKPNSVLQIDLQPPLKLTKATQEGKVLKVTKRDMLTLLN